MEAQILVREGERERRVEMTEASSNAKDSSERSARHSEPPRDFDARPRQRPVAGWVLAGVSAVAFVGAAATSAAGWGIRSHLVGTCSPECSEAQVQPLRVLWPVSFAALGVGIVSGIAAAALLLGPRDASTEHVESRFYDGSWRF
jgi:hypothetical protein